MFENMSKFQLRAACRSAGIKNASKMTNDQMREALAAHTQDNLQPSQMVEPLDFTGHCDIPDGTFDDVPAGTNLIAQYEPLFPREHQSQFATARESLVSAVNDDFRRESDLLELKQAMGLASKINNTAPRNRAGRNVPSRFRTAGRLRRFEDRQHLQPK